MKHKVKLLPLAGTDDEYEVACSCNWNARATSERFAEAIKLRHLTNMVDNARGDRV